MNKTKSNHSNKKPNKRINYRKQKTKTKTKIKIKVGVILLVVI